MAELRNDEYVFELSSAVDQVGRVFRRQGRVFRAVASPHVEFVLHTLSLAKKGRWFDVGLIPTWCTEDRLPEFPLVLEHQCVPFITLRSEWSAEGLRAAGLVYLRVAEVLAEEGLCLKDAHPWNVLFDRSIPYVIDWGSIRPMAELDWTLWYLQFRKYFLVPLYLFSIGQLRIPRAMLREHVVGVGNELMDIPIIQWIPERPYRIYQQASSGVTSQTFAALADYIASLPIPIVSAEWTDYPQPRFSGPEDMEHLRSKDRLIAQLLSSDPAITVLDIGCNHGLHSEIGATLGKQVVAGDIEEACINALFLRTVNSGRDILTLYLDFLWPMGESGITGTIPSVHQRLQCDTTLALALVHHLSFKHHLAFEAFARNISRFTRHRAIAEFVPPDDVHVAQWAPQRLPWYNLDNFIKAMREYFASYTIIPIEPEPRKIVVFEKRKWTVDGNPWPRGSAS